MKLELEVLASSAIKRKKPWPKAVFLGSAAESIFLLDKQRLSVLYLPSGKTKRKVPKITPMLPNTSTLTYTANGHFLAGLLQSGDLFIWHKDTDLVKYIKGLPSFKSMIQSVQDDSKIFLLVSGEAQKVVLVFNYVSIFLWETNQVDSFFEVPLMQSTLKGEWRSLVPGPDIIFPAPVSSQPGEAVVTGEFFISDVMGGLCCSLVFVFTQGSNICLTSLMMFWFDELFVSNPASPTFQPEWSCLQYPMSVITPRAEVVMCPGALVGKISRDGQLAAVAVNQMNTSQNRIVFVSPWTDTMVVSDLKSCGLKEPITSHTARSFWVSEMEWTPDDLFLVCVLRQGSVCMLTRLGEPLLLQTFGCSVEMGPRLFLPLHPLITFSGKRKPGGGEDYEDRDPLRQRFSITCHPWFPVLICSDGYMVTVLQLPGDTTCLSLMTGLSMEASYHLQQIKDKESVQLTLFDSIKRKTRELGKDNTKNRISLVASKRLSKKYEQGSLSGQYQFEATPADVESQFNNSLNSSSPNRNSGAFSAVISAASELGEGKISFGELGDLETTLDYRLAAEKLQQDTDLSIAEHLGRAQNALMLAWSLAITHSGLWTVEHEGVVEHVVANMVQLFSAVLQFRSKRLREIGVTMATVLQGHKRAIQMRSPEHSQFGKKLNRRLLLVLNLYKSIVQLIRFDAVGRHLMVTSVRLALGTTQALLKSKLFSKSTMSRQGLYGCYALLNYTESTLARVYVSIPSLLPWYNQLPSKVQTMCKDVFKNSVLVYLRKAQVDSQVVVETEGDDAATQNSQSTETPVAHLHNYPRLGVAWLSLYKHAVRCYKDIRENSAAGGDAAVKQDIRFVWNLLMTLQTKLHSVDVDLPTSTKYSITAVDRQFIEGDYNHILSSIMSKLSALSVGDLDQPAGTNLLLGLLYAHLLQNKPAAALGLVRFVLLLGDVQRAAQVSMQNIVAQLSVVALASEPPNNRKCLPELLIKQKAARHLTLAMARIMASYFTNKPLYVYPPLKPAKIPSLLASPIISWRILPVDSLDLTKELSVQNLSEAWSVEQTLELLLVAGALPEAVWLADQLSDWKTAVMLGAALQGHMSLSPTLYKRKSNLNLPPRLEPETILKGKLKALVTEVTSSPADKVALEEHIDDYTLALKDLLTAACLCGLDLTPWLLGLVVYKLKEVASRLTPLVPSSVYLPAPPVYCILPPLVNRAKIDEEAAEEDELRRQASRLVRFSIIVLTASHCALPAGRWYASQVVDALAKGLQFKDKKECEVDIAVLQQSFLSKETVFDRKETDSSIHSVLESLRDMLSIVWLMHTRDQVSLVLRKKAKMMEEMCLSNSSSNGSAYQTLAQDSLRWIGHLLPYSQFLPGGVEAVGSILLTLVGEKHVGAAGAYLLSQYFPHADDETLEPALADRLKGLLKDLQRRETDSDKVHTLYRQYCEKYSRRLKLKIQVFGEFEKYISLNSSQHRSGSRRICIGSRQHESEEDFLLFLDNVFAICFSAQIEEEQESSSITYPLLKSFWQKIRAQELESDAHKAITSFQRKELIKSARKKLHNNSKSSQLRKAFSTQDTVMNDSKGDSKHQQKFFRSQSISSFNHSDVIQLSAVSNDDLSTPQTSTPRSAGKRKKSSKKNKGQTSVENLAEVSEISADFAPLYTRQEGPLAGPVLEGWVLNNYVFGERYEQVENLMNWLYRWTTKHYSALAVLETAHQEKSQSSKKSLERGMSDSRKSLERGVSVIRLRLNPLLVVYSLWQLDYNYYKHITKLDLCHDLQERKTYCNESTVVDDAPMNISELGSEAGSFWLDRPQGMNGSRGSLDSRGGDHANASRKKVKTKVKEAEKPPKHTPLHVGASSARHQVSAGGEPAAEVMEKRWTDTENSTPDLHKHRKTRKKSSPSAADDDVPERENQARQASQQASQASQQASQASQQARQASQQASQASQQASLANGYHDLDSTKVKKTINQNSAAAAEPALSKTKKLKYHKRTLEVRMNKSFMRDMSVDHYSPAVLHGSNSNNNNGRPSSAGRSDGLPQHSPPQHDNMGSTISTPRPDSSQPSSPTEPRPLTVDELHEASGYNDLGKPRLVMSEEQRVRSEDQRRTKSPHRENNEEIGHIVRRELRKIVELQQSGLSALLNNLSDTKDQQPGAAPRDRQVPSHLPATLSYMGDAGVMPKQPVECTVMTAQMDAQGKTSPDTFSNSGDSSVHVTPLPSDVLDSDRSDLPLTVSQLKGHAPGHGKNMETTGAFSPKLRNEFPLQARALPENVRQAWQPPVSPRKGEGKENQGMHNSNNPENPIGIPLLHLKQDDCRNRVFPPIQRGNSRGCLRPINMGPRAAGQHMPMTPHMPLLSPRPSSEKREVLADYSRHEFPERDSNTRVAQQPNSHSSLPESQQQNIRCQRPLPMPLLQLPKPEAPRPWFMPPHMIAQYEQQVYGRGAPPVQGAGVKGNARDWQGYHGGQRKGQSLDRFCKANKSQQQPLLQVDKEAFHTKDDRDKPSRVRHRQSQNEGDLKETDASQGSLPQEGMQSPPNEQSQTLSKKTPTAEENRVRNAIKDANEKMDGIQHGYAISPGMFDGLFKDDSAWTAQQPPNPHDIIQYGVATQLAQERAREFSERQLQEAEKSYRNQGTDPSRSIDMQARNGALISGMAGANILPPDVFLNLDFGPNTEEYNREREKVFLNVLDINDGQLLNEIAGTIPQRGPITQMPHAVDMQGNPLYPQAVVGSRQTQQGEYSEQSNYRGSARGYSLDRHQGSEQHSSMYEHIMQTRAGSLDRSGATPSRTQQTQEGATDRVSRMDQHQFARESELRALREQAGRIVKSSVQAGYADYYGQAPTQDRPHTSYGIRQDQSRVHYGATPSEHYMPQGERTPRDQEAGYGAARGHYRQRQPGHDSTTSQLLGSVQAYKPSEQEVEDYRKLHQGNLQQRLTTMNRQFDSLTQLASQIQKEFEGADKISNTLDKLAEKVLSKDERLPSASVLQNGALQSPSSRRQQQHQGHYRPSYSRDRPSDANVQYSPSGASRQAANKQDTRYAGSRAKRVVLDDGTTDVHNLSSDPTRLYDDDDDLQYSPTARQPGPTKLPRKRSSTTRRSTMGEMSGEADDVASGGDLNITEKDGLEGTGSDKYGGEREQEAWQVLTNEQSPRRSHRPGDYEDEKMMTLGSDKFMEQSTGKTGYSTEGEMQQGESTREKSSRISMDSGQVSARRQRERRDSQATDSFRTPAQMGEKTESINEGEAAGPADAALVGKVSGSSIGSVAESERSYATGSSSSTSTSVTDGSSLSSSSLTSDMSYQGERVVKRMHEHGGRPTDESLGETLTSVSSRALNVGRGAGAGNYEWIYDPDGNKMYMKVPSTKVKMSQKSNKKVKKAAKGKAAGKKDKKKKKDGKKGGKDKKKEKGAGKKAAKKPKDGAEGHHKHEADHHAHAHGHAEGHGHTEGHEHHAHRKVSHANQHHDNEHAKHKKKTDDHSHDGHSTTHGSTTQQKKMESHQSHLQGPTQQGHGHTKAQQKTNNGHNLSLHPPNQNDHNKKSGIHPADSKKQAGGSTNTVAGQQQKLSNQNGDAKNYTGRSKDSHETISSVIFVTSQSPYPWRKSRLFVESERDKMKGSYDDIEHRFTKVQQTLTKSKAKHSDHNLPADQRNSKQLKKSSRGDAYSPPPDAYYQKYHEDKIAKSANLGGAQMLPQNELVGKERNEVLNGASISINHSNNQSLSDNDENLELDTSSPLYRTDMIGQTSTNQDAHFLHPFMSGGAQNKKTVRLEKEVQELTADLMQDSTGAPLSPPDLQELLSDLLQSGETTEDGLTTPGHRGSKSSRDQKKSAVDEQEQRMKREELLRWMKQRQSERLKEYRNHRHNLQQREAKPFKPDESAKKSSKTNSSTMLHEKQKREDEYRKLREAEAAMLMQDILADTIKGKQETLTSVPSSTQQSMLETQHTAHSSTLSKPFTRHATQVGKPMKTVAHSHRSTPVQQRLSSHSMRQRTPSPTMRTRTPSPKPLKPGSSNRSLSGTREAQVGMQRKNRVRDDGLHDAGADDDSGVAYQPRPFTELVRMQRPEATRNRKPNKPEAYVRRLSQIAAATPPSSVRTMTKTQPKIQPDTRKTSSASGGAAGPVRRQVKTYTQRLQDMKQSPKTYSTPIVPAAARRKPSPSQAKESQPKAGEVKNATITIQRQSGEFHLSPAQRREQTRTRPYASPYIQQSNDLRESDMSWTLSDTMRKIIYGGQEDVPSDDLPSELSELDEAATLVDPSRPPTDQVYTDQVAVEDLNEAASAASGSIMSFIDWDQVDNLIAEVHVSADTTLKFNAD